MRGPYATVTSKGQLVVPANLRRKYGIRAGTQILFIERGDEIVLQPLTPEYMKGICGMLKSETSVTEELVAEHAREVERDQRHEKRRSR